MGPTCCLYVYLSLCLSHCLSVFLSVYVYVHVCLSNEGNRLTYEFIQLID